jgi:hypothetical protein
MPETSMKHVFYPEDGGDVFLRNVGRFSTDYMALFARKHNSSYDKHFLDVMLLWDVSRFLRTFVGLGLDSLVCSPTENRRGKDSP